MTKLIATLIARGVVVAVVVSPPIAILHDDDHDDHDDNDDNDNHDDHDDHDHDNRGKRDGDDDI